MAIWKCDVEATIDAPPLSIKEQATYYFEGGQAEIDAMREVAKANGWAVEINQVHTLLVGSIHQAFGFKLAMSKAELRQ